MKESILCQTKKHMDTRQRCKTWATFNFIYCKQLHRRKVEFRVQGALSMKNKGISV